MVNRGAFEGTSILGQLSLVFVDMIYEKSFHIDLLDGHVSALYVLPYYANYERYLYALLGDNGYIF